MLVSQLINGITLGSSYALVALGFSLVFGVLRLLNLAQGDILMIGAFVGLLAGTHLGGGLVVELAAGLAAGAAAGLLLECLVLRNVRSRTDLSMLLATVAVSILLQTRAERLFGREVVRFPPPMEVTYVNLGLAHFSTVQVAILIVALLVMWALRVGVARTRLGLAVRATAADPEVAATFGVNPGWVRMVTVSTAGALGGVAGVLLGIATGAISVYIGGLYALKGLVIVIVGGVGSIAGALVGGLLLGTLEVLTVAYVSSGYRDAIAFAVLFVVLLLRPTGLFGERG